MFKKLTRVANKTKRSWTYMREKGVDSSYLFLHPGFSIVARLAHTAEFFKKAGCTRETSRFAAIVSSLRI